MLKITTQKNEKGVGISFLLETASIKKSFYNFIFPIKIFFHSKINNIKLKAKGIALILRANPKEISLERDGNKNSLSLSWEKKEECEEKEETLNLFEKPVYKKEKQPNLKEDAVRAIAGLNIILLILQASMLGSFFISPQIALAEEMCEVSVDAVLIMDVSGSMADGEVISKCEWSEIKPHGAGNTWFLNTKYNISEEWCQNVRDSFDEDYPVFQFVEITYTPAQNAKIVDAKTAGKSFLDNFKSNDQSALVSFSDNAQLIKELSIDHLSTKTEINNLTTSGATNIGDAINEGINELLSIRANPQANPVMILLTDGKANKPNGSGYGEDPLDVQYAKDKAQEAANKNYKIFTVGLGSNSDINETMLQEIADITEAKYYHSPNGNGLSQIYDEIAWEICQYGSISGCKYEDSNNDGDIISEIGLDGWEIILSGGTNGPLSRNTDQDGCYKFAGLSDGNYSISEGPNLDKETFIQTYPIPAIYENKIISNHNDIENIDFGNYFPVCGNSILDDGEECDEGENNGDNAYCSSLCAINSVCNDGQDNDGDGLIDYPDDPGCDSLNDNDETDAVVPVTEISGCKYYDINNNNQVDAEELKLGGWTIILEKQIVDQDWQQIATTTTAENGESQGCYVFPELEEGNYRVSESLEGQTNWLQTYPQNPLYWEFTLIEGQATSSINFANYLPICGNSIVDEGEACDDGNIQDGDGCSSVCESEGGGGPVCGNGILENGEGCDDGNLVNGDGCSNQCIVTYECNDGVDNDQDGLTDFSEDPGCSSATDDDETDEEIGIQEGDIVINEIMQNPSGMTFSIKNNKQWFEVYNNSNKTIDLQDCVLSDNIFNSHIIQNQLIINTGDYVVLGHSDDKNINGNVDVDYVYFPGFFLRDSSDEIILTCDSVEIDRVEYDNGATFPDSSGKSMILADPSLDNNIGSNWCESSSFFGDGDLGTPRTQNDACSGTCVYSDWQDNQCASDGFMGQTRIQISDFEYCTDLEKNIEDSECACAETEVPGDCVSNTNRRYTYTYNFNYCTQKDPVEEEDETCAGSFVGATISGCKYIDSNNDGDITGEELTTDSWLIAIESPILGELTENGCYVFSGLDPGTYTIYEEENLNRTPFIQTYPSEKSYTITVSQDESVTGIDFGNYFPICGNNILDEEEECDDGENNGDNTYCSSLCTINSACNDGQDNDGDGLIDHPNDPDCSNINDDNEETAPEPTSSGGGGGAVLPVNLFIYNEKQGDVSENGVKITWQTSLYASTQVIYSSEDEDHFLDEEELPHYGYENAFPNPSDETMISVHRVTIPDCEPCTTYYYRIVSYTRPSSPVFSEEMSFATLCTQVSPELEPGPTPIPELIPSPIPEPGTGSGSLPGPAPEPPEPSPEPSPLPSPEPSPLPSPEPSPELEARGFMPNLFADIGNILGGFGTTCRDALPWWTILLFAAYALFQGLLSRFKSSIIMTKWLSLAGGLTLLAVIFFTTGYRQVTIWVFLLVSLLMVIYWRFLIFQRKIKFNYDQGIV